MISAELVTLFIANKIHTNILIHSIIKMQCYQN